MALVGIRTTSDQPLIFCHTSRELPAGTLVQATTANGVFTATIVLPTNLIDFCLPDVPETHYVAILSAIIDTRPDNITEAIIGSFTGSNTDTVVMAIPPALSTIPVAASELLEVCERNQCCTRYFRVDNTG